MVSSLLAGVISPQGSTTGSGLDGAPVLQGQTERAASARGSRTPCLVQHVDKSRLMVPDVYFSSRASTPSLPCRKRSGGQGTISSAIPIRSRQSLKARAKLGSKRLRREQTASPTYHFVRHGFSSHAVVATLQSQALAMRNPPYGGYFFEGFARPQQYCCGGKVKVSRPVRYKICRGEKASTPRSSRRSSRFARRTTRSAWKRT